MRVLLRRRKARGAIRLVGWALLAVALVAGIWIVVTGVAARNHLTSVRAELPELRTALVDGDTVRAHAIAARIREHAARAHSLTSGPAWWVAASLPWVGSPLSTSRVIATEADRIGAKAVPGVLRLADGVRALAHVSHATVDLSRIAALAPDLRRAAATVHSAASAVRESPPSWLGAVSSARRSLNSTLAELDGELSGANRALAVALPMLGESGRQRYFIGFMNEAESRGLGGIPGAFAIATADHGKITFTTFGSDVDLKGARADVQFDPGFQSLYGHDDPTGVIQNSDLSPNFSYAARIWAGMWANKSGQHVDGVLAIDPTALSYLLRVTGPARLANGSTVSGSNVVALTQQRQYQLYGSDSPRDNLERKAFLSGIAKAVAQKLTQGGNGAHLLSALSRAAGERRLLVWSEQPHLEQLITAGGWSGKIDPTRPLTGFVVNNAAGSKLDYYLDRTMTYSAKSCDASRQANATYTVTNSAPRTGLPPYVTIRADKPGHPVRAGDNHLLVSYYGTRGATVASLRVDGKSMPVSASSEDGFLVVTVDLELPVGASRTISISLHEPANDQPLQVLRQPLARPMPVRVAQACGRQG